MSTLITSVPKFQEIKRITSSRSWAPSIRRPKHIYGTIRAINFEILNFETPGLGIE